MSDTAQLLTDWQGRLAIITRNANDLVEAEFSKRIRNRLRDGRYSGTTYERAGIAVGNLTALMDDYLVLARVVEEAIEQNRGSFLQTREEKDARVHELLEGPSVELPSVHVPLPQRDLLTAASAAPRATPAELLNAMQHAFAQARDTMAEIDRAETESMAAIDALKREYADLLDRAARVGAVVNSVVLNEMSLDQTDPLRNAGLVAAQGRTIATLRSDIELIERERDTALAGVERARQGIAMLEGSIARREQSLEEARQVFGESEFKLPVEISASSVIDLEVWLCNLEKALSERRWRAVNTGLQRFESALATATMAAEGACRQVRAGLDEMADLKGRFKALRIKAQALQARMPATAGDLENQAQNLSEGFRARPFELSAQRERLAAYETHLLGLAQLRQAETK